jgi:hypothetical protein
MKNPSFIDSLIEITKENRPFIATQIRTCSLRPGGQDIAVKFRNLQEKARRIIHDEPGGEWGSN